MLCEQNYVVFILSYIVKNACHEGFLEEARAFLAWANAP